LALALNVLRFCINGSMQIVDVTMPARVCISPTKSKGAEKFCFMQAAYQADSKRGRGGVAGRTSDTAHS
jgi:hypothetical protein